MNYITHTLNLILNFKSQIEYTTNYLLINALYKINMFPSRITKSYNNNKTNAVETISGARAGLSETSPFSA